MDVLSEIGRSVETGQGGETGRLARLALDSGIAAEEILRGGLVPGMNKVGEKFKVNSIYIPEVLLSARAMKIGLAVISPHLPLGRVTQKEKVCIGTIRGDIHDIGKNLVITMLRTKGFEVFDLGTCVEPRAFVGCVRERGCSIVACSAMLTTTMDYLGDLVREMERSGLRNDVWIMVGGAPITQSFSDYIHADLYTPDAIRAGEAALAISCGLARKSLLYDGAIRRYRHV